MKKLSTFLLLGLFMINLASALEFDNTKEYNPITREATFYNTFLGFKTSEIGKARLDTPLNVRVGAGYHKVAEFDLWAYEDYNNILKQFTFTDMKKKEKISRDFDIKYKTTKKVRVDEYELDCFNSTEINGTKTRQCNKIITGSHFEDQEIWNKITAASLKKNEFLTIGIFTKVELGDYVDWIPTIYGIEIEEWATWTADLNVDLEAYYTFDDNLSSTNVIDSLGVNNGTVNGSTTDNLHTTDSINGGAFEFVAANEDYIQTDIDLQDYTSGYSLSFWFKWTDAYYYAVIAQDETDNRVFEYAYYGAGSSDAQSYLLNGTTSLFASDIPINSWIHIAVTNNGSGEDALKIYYNGSLDSEFYAEFITGQSTTGLTIAQALRTGNNNYFQGNIDEVAIWSRVLSQEEVTALASNITYIGGFDLEPTIILNSPENNINYSESPTQVNFSCYGSDDVNLTSVGLYISGSLDQLNASGINNTNYTFSKTLTDGQYNWTCEGTDNKSQTTMAGVRKFGVHSITPNVTIHFPEGIIDYHLLGENLTLNWTISEQGQNLTTHIVNCTYEYNGVITELNNTICTQVNQTSFTPVAGISNLTFRVTDEFDFINTTIVSWDYTLLEIDQSFSQNVIEGSSTIITANVTLQDGLRVSSVVLNYNGTEIPGSNLEYATNTYLLSISKEIPQVDADTNVSFFWNVTLEDGSAQETNTNNQTIFNVSVDNCSAFSNTIFNFTMVDEATQAILNGASENTSLKIDLTLSSADGLTEIIQFSGGFSEINPAAVCLNNEMGNSTLRMDAVIEYTAADKFVEFYNLQNFVFDETTASQNITLFNLEESEGLEFKITYKGQDFIPVRDIVLQIQRNYIDEGKFKTIEIPMSGSNAYTIAHLVPNDVIYNLIFLKNGSVLDAFSEIVADCQNPTIVQCEINLNALITGTDLFNIIEDGDFFSSLTFDTSTREVSATYGILSGTSGSASLNVTMIDNFGNNTACSDFLVAAGGTLSCTVPSSFGDSVVYARVILDDGIKREGYISLKDSPKDQYAGILIFSSIILLLFIFGIGVSDSPGLTGIFFIIGALLLVGLNIFYSTSWVGAGATILWFIIAVIMVIVKGGSKR